MSSYETDPNSYELWLTYNRPETVLQELEKLLYSVRGRPIIGLNVKRLRETCFIPFGGPDMFNRKASLYLDEIEAYNSGNVDEDKLARGWELSGLRRP